VRLWLVLSYWQLLDKTAVAVAAATTADSGEAALASEPVSMMTEAAALKAAVQRDVAAWLTARAPVRSTASAVLASVWTLVGSGSAAAATMTGASSAAAPVVDPMATTVSLGDAEAELAEALGLNRDGSEAGAAMPLPRRDSFSSTGSSGLSVGLGLGSAATEDAAAPIGWGPGEVEPTPGRPAYLLHPLLRHAFRSDGRVEGSGALYELSAFLRVNVKMEHGRIRLSRGAPAQLLQQGPLQRLNGAAASSSAVIRKPVRPTRTPAEQRRCRHIMERIRAAARRGLLQNGAQPSALLISAGRASSLVLRLPGLSS